MLSAVPTTGSEPAATTTAAAPERPGSPLEPRRLLAALRRARRALIAVTVVAAIGGAIGGKLTPKSYAAAATVLWEPPTVAHADPSRELATLAQSVKLPANLLVIRERAASEKKIEQLAKAVDVTLGENSMLLTVTAHESTPEKAAQLSQTTVDVFIEAQREHARERLREVVSALRQSLAQAEGEHDKSVSRYDAFRAENHVDDFPAATQAAIQEVARLRVAVNDAKVELGGVSARQEALRAAQARSPESVTLSRNEQNYDENRAGVLVTELTELRSRYAPDHPRVVVAEAELAALKARARTATPTVSGQMVGRSAIRDAISVQLEESAAVRSAVKERAKALETLRREAESRATVLTGVQGEAAGLLADVKVNEEHLALLLKQIAMAEDDVRSASSAFQVISDATPPEHSEKAIGRIIALATPLLVLLLGALAVAAREALRLRVVCGGEVAFFANAPLVWATSWPAPAGAEGSTLARELADVCEPRTGVLGIAALGDAEAARNLGELLRDRLLSRGKRVCLLDVAAPSTPAGTTVSELLEGRAFGALLASHARRHDLVLVLLPSAGDAGAMRSAVRWLDGLLVVVESGTQAPGALGRLGEAALVRGRGVGLVLVRVPPELLPTGHRSVGDPERMFRETALQRHAPAPPPLAAAAAPVPELPSAPSLTLDDPFFGGSAGDLGELELAEPFLSMSPPRPARRAPIALKV